MSEGGGGGVGESERRIGKEGGVRDRGWEREG